MPTVRIRLYQTAGAANPQFPETTILSRLSRPALRRHRNPVDLNKRRLTSFFIRLPCRLTSSWLRALTIYIHTYSLCIVFPLQRPPHSISVPRYELSVHCCTGLNMLPHDLSSRACNVLDTAGSGQLRIAASPRNTVYSTSTVPSSRAGFTNSCVSYVSKCLLDSSYLPVPPPNILRTTYTRVFGCFVFDPDKLSRYGIAFTVYYSTECRL